MHAPAAPHDPRSFVTPDAFEVSPELLGMPLATPGRRLVALLIDLAVIGLVTLVTSSFALVLGVVAAVFFVRAGFRRTPVRGSVFGRAMRLSVGCLGLFIGLVTAIAWASVGIGFGDDEDAGREIGGLAREAATGAFGRGLEALLGRAVGEALREAESAQEAELAMRDVAEAAEEMGLDREAVRTFLLDAVPADASWADRAPAIIEDVLEEVGPTEEPAIDPALEAEVAAYSLQEALTVYAALLEEPSPDEAASARRRALESRLAGDLAADTLRALAAVAEDLRDENRERGEELARAERALEEERGIGFLDRMRELVDVLGFGFGWASLYLTVALSTWSGRTVGKKLMGIRVLRLDGQPITWWVAFERAGGYAAGFATGLLGFAQVYWDQNRQGIHDRIVGTVVVREGAPRVAEWESAL